MGLFEEIDAHLGSGKTLHTRARGSEFRARVAGGRLVVESERGGEKAYTRAQVEAAAEAQRSDAPPLDDRSVQVARSWVGAILDSLGGHPNPAKVRVGAGKAAPAGRRAKAASTKRKKPARRGAGRSSALRAGDTAQPPAPSSTELAVSIGEAIAQAIRGLAPAAGSGSDPDRTSGLAEIEAKLTALNAQLEEAGRERADAIAQLEAAGERIAEAEAATEAARKEAKAYKAASATVAGIFVAAVGPLGDRSASPVPASIGDLLAEAAKTWKSAPSGSMGVSRSALELIVREVAARIPGGELYAHESFAPTHGFLMNAGPAKGNLAESDLHLARALYRRSSKTNHNEPGWKATATEALLLLAGVTAIAQRAFTPVVR